MSSTRYRGGSRSYYRSRSVGHERALEHIAAARRLTAELGGMDQEVKKYFFGLPPGVMSEILVEYERIYGRNRREYAEETIPKWRSGKVKMGGEVAERLFNLLPPRMPLGVKYKLVEGLWHHVGPSSKHRIRVGLDADLAQVVELARSKITEFVVNYKIPESIERRFDWLSAGDVSIKQMLLAHIQEIEKTVVVEAIRAQVPVMMEHMGTAGSYTGRLAQIVQVGKHELELLMDKTATGARVEDPSIPLRSAISIRSKAPAIIFWVITAIVVLWIISRPHR
jgi:hypothetical protein